MPAELIRQLSAGEVALPAMRAELAALRRRLGEREAELAQVRAQLRAFEGRYFRQVGVLYAELDEIEARIAEREVDLYDSDAARMRAEAARRQAEETQAAAYQEEELVVDEAEPPANLKGLFREVAKRIHPDMARDEAEAEFFTLLMARANQAYRRRDGEALQRLMEDCKDVRMDEGADWSAEMVQVRRQMQHARRDLAALDGEEHSLRSSELGQMREEAEALASGYRDFLMELAGTVREQIAEAQRRFELVDRQIKAHGR